MVQAGTILNVADVHPGALSNRFEATHPYPPDSTPPDPAGFTMPIVEYDRDEGTSVTGGYVYRGAAEPGLYGTYLCADFTVGSGALVQGPLLHLVMAMAGRSRYLTELDGDGVAELRHRIKPSRDTLTG